VGWETVGEKSLASKGVSRMSDEVVFETVTPVIPVLDLVRALERYRKLGFAVRAYGHGTGYGYVDPDGTLHRVGSRLDLR
jgi:hypothetical protein